MFCELFFHELSTYPVHHGKQLKDILTQKGLPLKEFASKLGVVRQSLYLYFGKERFDDEFIKLLSKAGIDDANKLFKTEVLPAINGNGLKKIGIPYLGELDIFAGRTDIANADLS